MRSRAGPTSDEQAVRAPSTALPTSERLISDWNRRDKSMEVGDYPTEGWRFWAMLTGIVMIGLFGLMMAVVVRG